MQRAPADWPLVAKVWILLGVLAWCLFLPSLFHSFFADDEIYLAFSNHILRELEPSKLYQLLLRPANTWEFLPVRDFTYWLDFRFYGEGSFGFHLSNVLLYAAAAVSFWVMILEALLLYRPEWRDRSFALAAIATALFVAHPAHVEAVAWVAARKDVLAGSLSMLSLALMLRARRQEMRWLFLIAALFAFLLACFSKAATTAIVIPLTIILIQGGLRPPNCPERRIRQIIGLLSVWGVAGVAAFLHLHFGNDLGIRLENDPGLFSSLERASRIVAALLELIVFPVDLALYHDIYQLGDWHWLLTLIVVGLALAALVLSVRKKATLWPLGILVCLAPMIPYLQLTPFSTWSMASERFVFVSVAGALMVLADLVGSFSRPLPVVVGGGVLFISMAWQSWGRVEQWQTTTALASHEYRRMPGNFNVAKDFIFFVAVNEEQSRRDEIIGRVEREDARRLLSDLVNVTLLTRRSREFGMNDVEKRVYCAQVAEIYLQHANGVAAVRHERDLTFNNFLRFVDRHMYYSLGDPKRRCLINAGKRDHE